MIRNSKRILLVVFKYTFLCLLTACQSGGGGGANGGSLTSGSNAPQLAVKSDIVLAEGESKIITVGNVGVDDGKFNRTDSIYLLIDAPANGRLIRNNTEIISGAEITREDINAGLIKYQHLVASEKQDNFTYSVRDSAGNESLLQTSFIRILEEVNNLGITYNNGNAVLSWTIPQSADINRISVVRRNDGLYASNLTEGILVFEGDASQIEYGEAIIYDPSSIDVVTAYYTIFTSFDETTYSNGKRVGVYCDTGQCVVVPELERLIRIKTEGDVETDRLQLIHFVWGTDTLPDRMPNSVSDITDSLYTEAAYIKELNVDIVFDPGSGASIPSSMWFFTPFNPNGDLLVYHQGHRGSFHLGFDLIQRFLEEGYYVLGVSMPINRNHDEIGELFDRPMRFFLEPVTVGLNFILADVQIDKIYMTGISGGGWTTVVYSALDGRIDASYPVAGTYPFYLRSQLPSIEGDFEQKNPEFYAISSYLDLYAMAASGGRKQLQVFNKFDSCCYESSYANSYRDFIAGIAEKMGGTFDVLIDDTHAEHAISSYALDVIMTDINAESLQ